MLLIENLKICNTKCNTIKIKCDYILIYFERQTGSNPVTPTRLSLDADRVQALSYASVLADMYHAYYKYDGNLSYPLYLLRSYLREI